MNYLNLAQDLMNQHPNQTIVVFINPYYYMFDNSIVEVGRFSNAEELAKAIADDSSKHHQAPRQGFGTAIYRRFTRKTHNRLNR